MAPEQRAILQRCSFASITPVWMVIVAGKCLYFGLSVAIAARSLAGCYFPRGCCVSACTSRGMKHSMGQLTFCQEGRKSVSALSCEDGHRCGIVWAENHCQAGKPFSFLSTKHRASLEQGIPGHALHYCLSQSMQTHPSTRNREAALT